jgi:hypothetical protein
MSEENFPGKIIADKLSQLGEAFQGLAPKDGRFPANYPGKLMADKIDELIVLVREGGGGVDTALSGRISAAQDTADTALGNAASAAQDAANAQHQADVATDKADTAQGTADAALPKADVVAPDAGATAGQAADAAALNTILAGLIKLASETTQEVFSNLALKTYVDSGSGQTKAFQLLGTAIDGTEHTLIELAEYGAAQQIEIGSETIHLNLNNLGPVGGDNHITCDTHDGEGAPVKLSVAWLADVVAQCAATLAGANDYTDDRVEQLRVDALILQNPCKESELPAGPFDSSHNGYFYQITDFDVTYQGGNRKGSAVWYDNLGNYYLAVDTYKNADEDTITENSNGEFMVADVDTGTVIADESGGFANNAPLGFKAFIAAVIAKINGLFSLASGLSAAIGLKYTKPSGGIPTSDLALTQGQLAAVNSGITAGIVGLFTGKYLGMRVNSGSNSQFILPLKYGNGKAQHDLMIDWGDGVIQETAGTAGITAQYQGLTHSYPAANTDYEIKIAGTTYLTTAENSSYFGLGFYGNTTGYNAATNKSKVKSLLGSPDFLLNASMPSRNYRYQYMFQNCAGLTELPATLLPSAVLEDNCYASMFSGCAGLTELPATLLPAKELENFCYASMFSGCAYLTELPATLLPADELKNYCYWQMFYGCVRLTSIPATLLPATVMADSCYSSMFSGCTNLSFIYMTPDWFTGKTAQGSMFRNCAKITENTAYADIPTGWK